ncbi:MAG: low temperature requirement protein A [Actinomycetales bacterium]|nr:low temperature requirement protein A [Candidatus Phosphoribacter baldrii]HRC12947.1 low temperature requirement protein A [Dermatophilaceae bacterium]
MMPSHRLRSMSGRDPLEAGRAASTLELLFDLTFVIGFGTAASQFAHYLAEGHVAVAVVGFVFGAFAVAWAWMNWSWFASAYDTDDWAYRLLTLVQMIGTLILSLGLPSLFASIDSGEHIDNRTMVSGYVVMRVPMIIQWLRAARADSARRGVCLIYARTIAVAQTGWVALALAPLTLWPSVTLALLLISVEIVGPVLVSRRHGGTPWHPHHIAERYGLLVIIALGEGLLGTMAALSTLFDASGWSVDFVLVGLAGVGLTFGIWWSYFLFPSGDLLHHHRARSPIWGNGHIPLLIAVVAVGGGLHLAAYSLGGEAALSPTATILAVAVPVAAYIALVYVLFGALTRALRPMHWWMLAGSMALTVTAVGFVAAGGAMPVGLIVVAAVPWVTVVGQEIEAFRHERESPVASRESVGT